MCRVDMLAIIHLAHQDGSFIPGDLLPATLLLVLLTSMVHSYLGTYSLLLTHWFCSPVWFILRYGLFILRDLLPVTLPLVLLTTNWVLVIHPWSLALWYSTTFSAHQYGSFIPGYLLPGFLPLVVVTRMVHSYLDPCSPGTCTSFLMVLLMDPCTQFSCNGSVHGSSWFCSPCTYGMVPSYPAP